MIIYCVWTLWFLQELEPVYPILNKTKPYKCVFYYSPYWLVVTYDLLEDRSIDDITSILFFFFFLYCIKQVDSMLQFSLFNLKQWRRLRQGRRLEKNEFISYRRISQMSRSVKYIYRSQNLLMFNNHHGNANVQFRMKIRKISHRRSCSPKYAEFGHFQLLFLQRTFKKCTKMYNARARLFFCSVNLLFGRVLVTVDVVVCLRSLIYHRRRQNVVKTSSGTQG